MTRLRYRARTAIKETGANPLYVTLGRLDWQLGDRDLSAPCCSRRCRSRAWSCRSGSRSTTRARSR